MPPGRDMRDVSRSLRLWITFAGCVLVVAVLYLAQVVLMPVALAILISFVLGPIVVRLQRWIGRIPAVLTTVVLAFAVLGLMTWGLGSQLVKLTADLPAYRANIRQKISDVRQAGRESSVQQVQATIEDIKTEIETNGDPAPEPEPVVVVPEKAESEGVVPTWLGPLFEPLATAGFVIALVIFMLLHRGDLRGRFIRLVGGGNLPVTTRALEEAGRRISRQLLMQSLVNLIYGVLVGIGLSFIGVPYAALFGTLAGVLRFVPYVGAFIGSAIPTLVALATLPGWAPALWVVVLFIGLELFTNLVLEIVLFAEAAGISQVALLVSVAFWTWLWGPMGLLMAMPLTVCLVVIGKHVSGLGFLATLMADTETLAPDTNYYQRVLARDPSAASELVERHVKSEEPATVFDALLLPALNYAARDRLEERLSAEEEAGVVESTREMMQELPSMAPADGEGPSEAERLRVLGCPAGTESDELALGMLARLLEGTSVRMDIRSEHLLPSDLIRAVQEAGVSVVCIADLPPRPGSRTRYLIKKLKAALPHVRIVVGRWAPPALADDDTKDLTEAGADHVGSNLLETRTQLVELSRLAPPPKAARRAAGVRAP